MATVLDTLTAHLRNLPPGEFVVVDGETGEVLVRPQRITQHIAPVIDEGLSRNYLAGYRAGAKKMLEDIVHSIREVDGKDLADELARVFGESVVDEVEQPA